MIHHYLDTTAFSKKEPSMRILESFTRFLRSSLNVLKTNFRKGFKVRKWFLFRNSDNGGKVDLLLNRLFQVFEELSAGQTLSEILLTLTSAIEKYKPEIHASILLLDQDGVTLRHSAAPSLPKEYCDFIDGKK
ncbi:hypothetical protein AB3N59_01460 [Leptospira sp. WS92.C1]